MKRNWIIWSIEHKAWWKPNWGGYTERRESAGRYSFGDALKIVKGANINENDIPNEAMVKIEDEL